MDNTNGSKTILESLFLQIKLWYEELLQQFASNAANYRWSDTEITLLHNGDKFLLTIKELRKYFHGLKTPIPGLRWTTYCRVNVGSNENLEEIIESQQGSELNWWYIENGRHCFYKSLADSNKPVIA